MKATTESKPKVNALPAILADVALLDVKACAAVGGMSQSWWQERVAKGEAPKPVIQRSRCTRWAATDVRAFWIKWAVSAAADTEAAVRVSAQARKASAVRQAKRAAASARAA